MTRIMIFASLLVGAAGCDLIDKATADRPNGTQEQAVGDVFAHLGAVGTVFGDPSSVNDADVGDMFVTAPYFDLLDPDGPRVSSRRAGGDSALTLAEGCMQIAEDGSVSFDCDLALEAATCNAVGSGSGDTATGVYAGSATLSGDAAPCAPTVTVDGAFTLSGTTATGTLSVDSAATAPFGFDLTIDNLELCENGLPLRGLLTVDGRGAADGLPFDPLTLEFTGDGCGFSIIQ